MTYLKPKDIIATVIIVCVTFLLFTGYTGPLTEVISLLIGYYFGHRTQGVDSGK